MSFKCCLGIAQVLLLIFAHFLEYFPLFLDNNVDEESELFSNSKSSVSECCLAFACVFFCQIQPGVAYESVAYKKAYS